MDIPSDPIDVFENERPYRLKFPADVNDRDLMLHVGKHQNKLFQDSSLEDIVLDFSSTTYADPNVLMVWLLTAAQLCISGKKIILKLCKKDDNSINKLAFLKHLARDGFLECILIDIPKALEENVCNGSLACLTGSQELTMELVIQLKRNEKKTIIERSYCLPMEVFTFKPLHSSLFDTKTHADELRRLDNKTDLILEQKISKIVRNLVPLEAQPSLLYKIRMVVREGVHNAFEHAYNAEDTQLGVAGVYIRFRPGFIGANIDERKFIEETANREGMDDDSLCPKLSRDFVDHKSGFFEIFITDVGHGLDGSSSDFHGIGLNKKMYTIFFEGYSNKSNRPTKFGGLHLLAELSSESNNDFARVGENNEWWGAHIPLRERGDEATPISTHKRVLDKLGAKPIRGCSFLFRYSWTDIYDIKLFSEWLSPKSVSTHITNPYIESENDLNLIDITIVDGRFSEFKDPEIQLKHGSQSLLFYPPNGLMKNAVQKEISNVVEAHGGSSLIIGDVPLVEALTYVSAIEENRNLSLKFPKLQNLVIFTSDLNFILYENCGNEGFKIGTKSKAECSKHLSSYVNISRKWESQLIWNWVTGENESSCIKKEAVEWKKGMFILGYLDFQQVFTPSINRRILNSSLRRYLCFKGLQEHQVTCIDSLVQSTAEEYTRQHPNKSNDKVFLGSICVSGSSAKNMMISKEEKLAYCYQHPNTIDTQLKDTLFTFGEEFFQTQNYQNTGYKRIGDTPFISKNGWKYYSLPRYEQNGKFAYVEEPEAMYEKFQSFARPIAKLGHWTYGKNHDFLSINMLSHFDPQTENIGLFGICEMYLYTMQNLFNVFTVQRHELSSRGKKVWDAAKSFETQFDGKIFPRRKQGKTFLFYPSHAVTEHIINTFKRLLENSSKIEDVNERTYPLVPTKKERNVSTFQLSGLVYEKLINEVFQSRAGKTPKVNGVIFDDAVISARTLGELENIIRGCGVARVFSINLYDRERKPFVPPNINNHKFVFSRVDLPTIGSKYTCVLCDALREAKYLQKNLLSYALRVRITDWLNFWEVKNVVSEWGANGLNPIPVKLSKSIKKYAFLGSEHSNAKIPAAGQSNKAVTITNSLGLITWITEMQTITGRDDLALIIVEEEDIPLEAKLQLLASQLLYFMSETHDLHITKIVYYIFVCLEKMPSGTGNTCLASLCLLNVPEKPLKVALKTWLSKSKAIDFFNLIEDLQIVISKAEINESNFTKETGYLSLSKLVRKPLTKNEYLWRFHYETMDVRGKYHTTVINRVANGILTYYTSIAEFNVALELISEITSDGILESHCVDVYKCRDKFIACQDTIKSIRVIQQTIGTFSERLKDNKKLTDLQKCLKKLLLDMKVVHEQFFQPLTLLKQTGNSNSLIPRATMGILRKINDRQDIHFSSTIKELENELNDTVIVKACGLSQQSVEHLEKWKSQKEFNEVYTLMDNNIMQVLPDILSNIKNTGKRKVSTPITRNETPADLAHCWINTAIDLREGIFKLEFYIHFNSQKGEVNEEHLDKLKRTLERVKRSNGGYKIFPNRDGYFLVELYLTFAHCLEH